MDFRRLILAALLLPAALATGCGVQRAHGAAAPVARARAARRANVVFVLTDDLSWDLLPYLPQVRRLQRDGMTFRQFLVSDSLCCSSRATIFTGQFPHNTGVLGNVPPFGGYPAFRDHGDLGRSVAIALQRAGYRTALFGKYLNDYHPRRSGIDPGWSDWLASSSGYRGYGYAQSDNGHMVVDGYRRRDYVTNVLARHALRFIRSSAGRRPFFAEVATYAPHKPFVAAPRDRHRFRHLRLPREPGFDGVNTDPPAWLGHRHPLTRAQRRALVHAFRARVRSVQDVDRMVGRIRAALHAAGVAHDTYVVFTSDNGYHLGEHRLMGGKRTAFDEDIRVPLIVAGPGVPHGSRTSAMTGTVDLAPTFERWAGIRPAAWRDGRPLTPLLHGGRTPRDWRRALLIEHFERRGIGPDPDAQAGVQGRPSRYAALRTRRWTYVQYADGEREFYDRLHDPGELHNIASRLSHARLAALRAELARYRRCRGEQACTFAGLLH